MTEALAGEERALGEPSHPRVDAAIAFLVANHAAQPSLEEAAAVARMSAHHFQRTFKAWTGVSPKRFLQYVTLGHAKRLLGEGESVLGAALAAGLSGPGRLHDLFVACEAVTPGEFKRRGAGLVIAHAFHDNPFGRALVGVSERGVCWLGFVAGGDDAGTLRELAGDWPAARLVHDPAAVAGAARAIFARASGERLDKPLPLLLRGTNFQIKVWEALLAIPPGAVASYRDIAEAIGHPAAVRAVGRAVGANPISLVIPCHRVILKSGVVHNYRWGVDRKRTILALEAARAAAAARRP